MTAEQSYKYTHIKRAVHSRSGSARTGGHTRKVRMGNSARRRRRR